MRCPRSTTDGKGPEELAQILRESPQAATSLIRNALTREEQTEGKPNARLALVVDQMEEMYTQEEIPSGHRQSFFEVIDGLARSGRVWVICTLRSDFYPRLANHPESRRAEGRRGAIRPDAAERQRDRADDPPAGECRRPAIRGGPGEQRAPRRHAARCRCRAPGNPALAAVHPRGAVPAPHGGRHAHPGRVSRPRWCRGFARATSGDRIQATTRRRRSRAAEGTERAREHRTGRSGGDRSQAGAVDRPVHGQESRARRHLRRQSSVRDGARR